MSDAEKIRQWLDAYEKQVREGCSEGFDKPSGLLMLFAICRKLLDHVEGHTKTVYILRAEQVLAECVKEIK